MVVEEQLVSPPYMHLRLIIGRFYPVPAAADPDAAADDGFGGQPLIILLKVIIGLLVSLVASFIGSRTPVS